jgi:hypothetical protein
MRPEGDLSCADCHRPNRGFTDGRIHGGFRTPSLLNCVYNESQFADGRVKELEQVYAQSPEDERDAPPDAPFRHAWGGVERLRKDPSYRTDFRAAFGCPPTQDAVGKALATYLRTLLSGNSLQDQVLAEMPQKGTLTEEDYLRVLDRKNAQGEREALKKFRVLLEDARLPRDWQEKDAPTVARELLKGYQAFHRRDGVTSWWQPPKPHSLEFQRRDGVTRCVVCHSGPTSSDQGFHSLGVGVYDPDRGYAGRFSATPIGLRAPGQVGAFKTPRLRNRVGVGPYFHNGEQVKLEEVVRFHLHGGSSRGPGGMYLDPVMREIKELAEAEGARPEVDLEALTVFLVALQGEKADDSLLLPRSSPP